MVVVTVTVLVAVMLVAVLALVVINVIKYYGCSDSVLRSCLLCLTCYTAC